MWNAEKIRSLILIFCKITRDCPLNRPQTFKETHAVKLWKICKFVVHHYAKVSQASCSAISSESLPSTKLELQKMSYWEKEYINGIFVAVYLYELSINNLYSFLSLSVWSLLPLRCNLYSNPYRHNGLSLSRHNQVNI